MANRMKIIEYFDSLINEVDIKAEKLLELYHVENLQQLINNTRQLFINEIELIKNFNLSNLSNNEDENFTENDTIEDRLYKKYCFTLDKHLKKYFDLAFENSVQEKIREKFGFLIVTDAYISKHKLSLFRELLSYGSDSDDEIDENNSESKESNIFNHDLKYLKVI